jgi:hypothetical protein
LQDPPKITQIWIFGLKSNHLATLTQCIKSRQSLLVESDCQDHITTLENIWTNCQGVCFECKKFVDARCRQTAKIIGQSIFKLCQL